MPDALELAKKIVASTACPCCGIRHEDDVALAEEFIRLKEGVAVSKGGVVSANKRTMFFWGTPRHQWRIYGVWWRQRILFGVSIVADGEEWQDADREVCVCAAIRLPSGYIVRGHCPMHQDGGTVAAVYRPVKGEVATEAPICTCRDLKRNPMSGDEWAVEWSRGEIVRYRVLDVVEIKPRRVKFKIIRANGEEIDSVCGPYRWAWKVATATVVRTGEEAPITEKSCSACGVVHRYQGGADLGREMDKAKGGTK